MLLAEFDTVTGANEGAKIMLRNNHKELTDRYIRVAGVDSDAHKTAKHEVDTRRLKMLKSRNGKNLDASELYELDLILLAGCTLEWNLVDNEGKSLKCDRATAMNLYRGTPFIARQVDEAIADDENFTQR